MDNLTLLIIVAVLFFGYVIYNTFFSSHEAVVSRKKIYQYKAKECVMTQSEVEFFQILIDIAGDRYYVFPQTHLSALLDEKVPKQNWKAAFRHVNSKSVDFVLCNKITLKPAYAVELDDRTHERFDRIERDTEVERIFKGANVPLVRFSDYRTLTKDAIENRFIEANSLNS